MLNHVLSFPSTRSCRSHHAATGLCDPVVLFHDFAPQGVAAAEVYDRGLGRLPGIIALPHAKRRLRLDDRERMRVLVDRFPRHVLTPLDDGTVVRFPNGSTGLPEGARAIGRDGAPIVVEAS